MDVVKALRHHFAFLESDFGFRVKKRRNDRHTPFIQYVGDGVGVVVQYDARDACLDVSIYELAGGQFPERHGYVVTSKGYHLNNIVFLHDPSAMVGSLYSYGQDDALGTFDGNVSKVAENLRTYATDLLEGDFRRAGDIQQAAQEMLRARRELTGTPKS